MGNCVLILPIIYCAIIKIRKKWCCHGYYILIHKISFVVYYLLTSKRQDESVVRGISNPKCQKYYRLRILGHFCHESLLNVHPCFFYVFITTESNRSFVMKIFLVAATSDMRKSNIVKGLGNLSCDNYFILGLLIFKFF